MEAVNLQNLTQAQLTEKIAVAKQAMETAITERDNLRAQKVTLKKERDLLLKQVAPILAQLNDLTEKVTVQNCALQNAQAQHTLLNAQLSVIKNTAKLNENLTKSNNNLQKVTAKNAVVQTALQTNTTANNTTTKTAKVTA